MTKAKLYFTDTDPQEINDLESQNLIITGISTLGITTTTNLTSQQLNVSGIATVGLGSTSSPQLNSQMSFELTNNTTLTVRVKGTDGIIRLGTVALS